MSYKILSISYIIKDFIIFYILFINYSFNQKVFHFFNDFENEIRIFINIIAKEIKYKFHLI